MTKLEVAFTEAAKLPAKEQEALATWILDEIASEKRWSELFYSSQDELSKMADEALNNVQGAPTSNSSRIPTTQV